MTERDAFILGVSVFCKQAGMDADDTWEMTRLLLMEPFRAKPIIKRAAQKRAWTFWGTDKEPGVFSHLFNPVQQYKDMGELGVNVFGRLGHDESAQILKNREDQKSMQEATQSLSRTMSQHPMTTPQAEDIRKKVREVNAQMKGLTDEKAKAELMAKKKEYLTQYNNLVNDIDPSLEANMDAGRQAVATAQAKADASLADVEAGNVKVPRLATSSEAAEAGGGEGAGPKSPAELLEAAGKGTRIGKLISPDIMKNFANASADNVAYRDYARMIQRTNRVSDPRFMKNVNWNDPKMEGFRTYLERTRGPLNVRSGASSAPQRAAAVMSSRGNRPSSDSAAPQQPQSSSPPVDVPKPPQPSTEAGGATDSGNRAAHAGSTLARLAGPVPGVQPGTNVSSGSTGGGATTQQTTQTKQPPAWEAKDDMAFANNKQVQDLAKETQNYKRYGGTGSVQVGLPSGGTYTPNA